MVLHVSEISDTGEKHPLIEELGELVNKKKNPGIDAILEVTYGYKSIGNKRRYNTSLFQEYCGVTYISPDEKQDLLAHDSMPGCNYDSPPGVNLFQDGGEVMDYGEIKNIFISKAQGDVKRFHDLAIKVKQANIEGLALYGIGVKEVGALLQTIEHNVCLLELAINSIDFELEKAGYEHGLDDSQIKDKIKENERLEEIVFGGNILENQKESEYAYQYLMNGWERYKSMDQDEKEQRVTNKLASRVLDSKEQNRLEGYMGRIGDLISEKGYSTEPPEEIEEKTNSTREFFKKFAHVQIPRDVIVKFFQGTINVQGMKQAVEVTGKSSVYDGPTKLEIPDNENFEVLDFERVCGLLVHEISAHYVNQANHEAGVYGDARLSGNIEKEEGLATLVEKSVKGLPVSGADVMTPTFVMVLASEIFSGEELKDFIDLYMDISERKSSPEVNMNRRKRNYPDDYVGVQHKDVAYVRGLMRVTKYLGIDSDEEGGNIENLFVGKVGMQSIIKGDFQFEEEKMLFPILNVEIMLFYIMNAVDGKTLKDSGGHEWFMKYMREKYKGIVSEESFKKLEATRLSGNTFRGVLRTIGPIINQFQEQNAANDNLAPAVRDTIGSVEKEVHRLTQSGVGGYEKERA